MSIISDFKEYAGLIKALGNQDLYRKIVELQGEVVELVSQNHDLKEKNSDLTKKLGFQGKLKFKAPFYYHEGDEVPFCPQCWEKNHEAIHLVSGDGSNNPYLYGCLACKSEIRNPSHPPAAPKAGGPGTRSRVVRFGDKFV